MQTHFQRHGGLGTGSCSFWGGRFAAAAVATLSGCAINLSCPAPIVHFPSGVDAGTAVSVVSQSPASEVLVDPAMQMIAQVSFKTNRTKLPSLEVDAASLGVVQEIARSIRKGRIVPVTVTLIGYADSAGSKLDADSLLSARRVNAVRNLLERMDVDTALVRTESRGSALTALCAGLKAAKLDECLRLNRRVDIVVDGARAPKNDV